MERSPGHIVTRQKARCGTERGRLYTYICIKKHKGNTPERKKGERVKATWVGMGFFGVYLLT